MGKKKGMFDINTDLKDVNIPLLIGLMATSIGAFGGFPKTPKKMEEFLEKYPKMRFALVYVLLWQGMGGQHEMISLLGTGVTYLIWEYLNSLDEDQTAEAESNPEDNPDQPNTADL